MVIAMELQVINILCFAVPLLLVFLHKSVASLLENFRFRRNYFFSSAVISPRPSHYLYALPKRCVFGRFSGTKGTFFRNTKELL